MLEKLALGMVLCGYAASASATQGSTGTPHIGMTTGLPASQKPATADSTASSKPSGGDGGPKFWFQVELAPELVSQDPFAADSATTDATDVKWTFGLNYTLRGFIDIEATAGPSATIDSDNDSSASSRLAGALYIQTTNPMLSNAADSGAPWTLRPFLRYQRGRRYTDFFEVGDGTEQTFDAGLTYQRKFPGVELSLEVAPRGFESTRPGEDYRSLRAFSRLKGPLIRGVADFRITGEIERRWFQETDPLLGAQRRDWRFQAFAGLNFAPAANRYLNRGREADSRAQDIVREFTIGGRWIEIGSNVDSQDRSTVKFTPAIQIRVGFN